MHFNVVCVTHLLDDSIVVGSPNEPTCLNSLLAFESLALEIGIPLNEGKRCHPVTCQIVYGIEIDTTTMQVRVTDDKLSKTMLLVKMAWQSAAK